MSRGGAGGELRPRSGEGRSQLVDHKALRLGILRNLSNWFERLTDAEGVLRCPRHKVEHTGKNVYAALVNHRLWLHSREEECLDRARRQVLRTVDMLGLDPGSQVPVFLPGRTDHRNASTNAIDGGACADVIATLLEEVPEVFSEAEQARCREALERHVEGYLRHAARERPIPAQRLWAGTGTARAARLLGRADWAADALAGCALALEELSPDGVAPYIPAGSDHCTHPGLADTSGFYHSRTPGFVLYVHQVLEEPLGEHARERLGAALDALVALRGGNGRKVIHNEAKAWYWESDYEVASHPFDAWALHVGARALGRPLYGNEAGAVMEEWVAHLSALDGGVLSHHGRGVNFQCRVFWSAHAAWVARIIEDVPLMREPREPVVLDLPLAGLLHVERRRYTAVLRGARRPSGNLFGCDVGGGALQSLVVRADPRQPHGEELVPTERLSPRREGSFLVWAAGGPGPLTRALRTVRTDRSDLRFRLYVATIEWRAGRLLGAPLYLLRHGPWRVLEEARAGLAAHRDSATTHVFDGRQVVFEGGVADRDGTRLPGATTRRCYVLDEERVELEDVLHLPDFRGRVRYRLPRRLVAVEVRCTGADVRRRGRWLAVRGTGTSLQLEVRGRWEVPPAPAAAR